MGLGGVVNIEAESLGHQQKVRTNIAYGNMMWATFRSWASTHAHITDVAMTLLYSFAASSLPLAVVRSYVFVAG